jgi:hypothetical protein
MLMSEVHDYANRLIRLHGDMAELVAAQKAIDCERLGERDKAGDWRRVRAALREMRGPHSS